MSKIRDSRTAEQTETRRKKLSRAGVNCYLTEGLSMNFLRELEKYSTHHYYLYGIKGSLDWWLDQARDKVIDSLPNYDPEKGPLAPFIYSCLRNKATNVSKRENRKVSDEGELESILTGTEGPLYVKDNLHLHAFVLRASNMGMTIPDPENIAKNTKEQIFVPMSQAYSWLRLKGEI